MKEENYHQKKVIDRLSRKIQKLKKEYRKLESKKRPPTLYGREVVVVPDSMLNEIIVVNKDFFDFS
ncbi:MAG: hypothetical protein IJO32_00465 [Bacilli bacterium]|nr:hypothetical protein [Bacilli bacterium]